MPLNQRELTTELHRTQEKMNKNVDELRKEIINQSEMIKNQENYIKLLKRVFVLVGVCILIFDVLKDSLSSSMFLHYSPGAGWQQWLLLVFGFFMIFLGIYKKSKGK